MIMKTNLVFQFIDNYFIFAVMIHIFLSVVIALIVAIYIKKRFVTTGYEHEDLKRLQLVENKTHFHRFLFHASLHRNNLKSSFSFFFIFNFSMPLVGCITAFWFAWQLVHTKYPTQVVSSDMLNLDEFGTSFLEVRRVFGEGSFNNIILSKHTSAQKKIHALNILSTNLTPANLRIIKQTLSSSEDEVRMFGYAIINKAEQKLAKSINIELELFKEAKERTDEQQMADSANELAFLYWEMLYSELSNETLNDEFMRQVRYYVELAIELFSNQFKDQGDANEDNLLFKLSRIHQLYGRYYMRLQEYENAITQLTLSQELHKENATFVLPYTAEAYFYAGRYDITKSILNQLSLLEINATIHPLIEQWKRSS